MRKKVVAITVGAVILWGIGVTTCHIATKLLDRGYIPGRETEPRFPSKYTTLDDRPETMRVDPRDIWGYRRNPFLHDSTAHATDISEFTETIRKDPEHASECYGFRGYTYADAGDYDKAITDLTEAIRLKPEWAEWYYDRGAVYAAQGKYDKSVLDFTKALDEFGRDNPLCYDVILLRGLAYEKAGNLDKAIADYTVAEAACGFGWVRYLRGDAYAAKADYDKAIADYAEALRLNPKFLWARYRRGEAYAARSEYDKAIADFNAFIEVHPMDALAYRDRGNAYKAKGEKDKAVTDYEMYKTLESYQRRKAK
jgi:tetratricopeptide (TPR) repeat protein